MSKYAIVYKPNRVVRRTTIEKTPIVLGDEEAIEVPDNWVCEKGYRVLENDNITTRAADQQEVDDAQVDPAREEIVKQAIIESYIQACYGVLNDPDVPQTIKTLVNAILSMAIR